MNEGWIKLYRKLADNDLITDPIAFTLFSFILLNVERLTGSMKAGRFTLALALRQDANTLYKALKRLEKKYNMISLTSNNKVTEISVLNWAKYQSPEELVTTKQQQSNNKVTLIQEERRENRETRSNRESSLSFLEELPEDVVSRYTTELEVSASQVREKGLALFNYCQAKGKKYKNYSAFLDNAMRKDFKKRIKQTPPPFENLPDISEAERARNLVRVEEMKNRLFGKMN